MLSFLFGLLAGLLIFGVPVYSEKQKDPEDPCTSSPSTPIPSKEI